MDTINIDKQYSSDSSCDVWQEYYGIFYPEIGWDFWRIFDYDKLKEKRNRFYAEYSSEKDRNSKYDLFKKCRLGGELDFNFGFGTVWQKSKYKYYEEWLKGDRKAVKLLEECKDRQYKRCNLSVIITIGGLNNVKGRASQDIRSLDRFDVFIYILDDYFKKRNSRNGKREDYMHIIFSEAWRNAKKNRECLYEYLRLFKDINDYFQKNYNIDNRDLIEKLIVSGNKSIDCKERVVEYLNLAQWYWDEKEKQINGIICKKKDDNH